MITSPSSVAADPDRGLHGTTVATHALPESRRSPGLAREILRAALTSFPADVVDVAELLLSELATNAVLHAEPLLILRLAITGHKINVSVEDASYGAPVPREASADDSNGRGLLLVDAMADSWGWAETETGKRVWFELS